MTATAKSSTAAVATAAALVAATAALCYSPFCSFLSRMFPKEAWGPGAGVELARAYMYPILIVSLAYLPMIYAMRRYMEHRPAYNLRGIVFVWNLLLSLLSLLGFMVVVIQQPGMFVVPMYPERHFSPPVRAVITIFTLTKTIEFGDTILLALKKKPLSFLHLYHHVTVSLYCWHAQYINADFAHGFVIMNLAVHAIMYLYFSLTCFFSPSKGSGKGDTRTNALQRILYQSRPLITILQILQMLVGMYLSLQGMMYIDDPKQVFNAQLALAMYTSYAVLFLHLYCSSYLPHFSSSRVLMLMLLHALAALGIYKLCCYRKDRLLVTLQMAVVAAVSLSLSCYTSSTSSSNSSTTSSKISNSNSGRVMLPLMMTFNWLYGVAHVMQQTETAREDERQGIKMGLGRTKTVSTPTLVEGKDGETVADAPSRCLSVSSTAADTTILSSCMSSIDDLDSLPSPTIAGVAGAAAASCVAAGGAAQISAETSSSSSSNTNNNNNNEKEKIKTERAMNADKQQGPFYHLMKKGRNLKLKWSELAAAAAGAAAPAVYGHLTNGDWGMGFCFFGALRWAIELHAAERIAMLA